MPVVPAEFSLARLRRARVAVGVCFFVNAVLYANVVPRLPDVKAELGLSNSSLGAAVAALPLGALVAGLSSAALMRRFGSARVATSGLVILALAVFTVSIAPNWPALAAAFLVAGALDAIVDVSQNAHGLRVQRLYQRSILNAFHGIWSIGAVTGGVIGSVAAGLDVPLVVHLGASRRRSSASWRWPPSGPCSPAGTTRTRMLAWMRRPRPRRTARPRPAAARGAPRYRRSRPSACSPRAVPSSRTPAPRGARSTYAMNWPRALRSPGWGSSRCRWP